jgi:hypothetical protein
MNIEEAEERRIESKMGHLIYTTIPEDNLRTLAKSWGVGSVDGKHIDIVRRELEARILSGEKTKKGGNASSRGIDEFINSSEVGFYDQVAALVRDAEEKGSLLFNVEERRWEIDYQDGNTPFILKELAGQEFQNPTEAIVSYLVGENEKLIKLEKAMGAKGLKQEAATKVEGGIGISMDDIRNEKSYAKLKSWANKYVPEFEVVKGVKNDDIKEALLTALFIAEGAND